jgi:hypothetical protein
MNARPSAGAGERVSVAPVPPAPAPGDDAPPGTPATGEQVCPACGGSGHTVGGAECPNCLGRGKVNAGIGGG